MSLKDPMEILGALLSANHDSSNDDANINRSRHLTRDDAIVMAKQAGADKAASFSTKHIKLVDEALIRVKDRQAKNQLVQGQLRQ